ncbi:MAG: NAD(P)-dependent oxidoreductase [Anaerolineae bacterium]|nr:NAD(P)-dependent oxidoreductase [Anaerolineae bacterium]
MQHIALIGLGIMGSGMAHNWLDKGYSLVVHNRTRRKAEPFAARGAQVAETPRQAAANADIIVVMVGDDDQSRAVWLGEDGALAGARAGAVLIDCSTVTPAWVRDLAQQAHVKGCDFLDSPVTGSKPQAAAGQLTLFVGGDGAVLERVRPALEAISRQIHYMGPTGTGATWKLINNMMAAVQMAALSEGWLLAEKAGVDLDQAAALIADSASSSPLVKGKVPRLHDNRYGDTDFALQWMLKDVRYALTLAEQYGLHPDTARAAEAIYQQAADKGLGEQDFASVIEGLRSKMQ